MRFTTFVTSAAVLAFVPQAGAFAQEQDGQETEDGSILANEILVLGDRIRGQIDSVQAPILELDEADIAAYGVSSIQDLVAAIEPQTGSTRGRGGGRPVFLVNGIRVGSFREFRSYPPEAIRKVEVLPEETAQRFGFPPNRRVINFILKDDYSAITAEVEYEQPDRGGYSRNEQELTLLQITKGGRLNLDLEVSDTSLLTEAERDLSQTIGSVPDVATDPDPAAFRSLIADSRQIEATANFAKAFIESGSSVSLNGTYIRNDSQSLSGLDSVILTDPSGNSALRTLNAQDPLERRTASDTFSAAASFNRPLGDWILTWTADGTLSDTTTEIDRRADVSLLVSDALSGALAIDGDLPGLTEAGFDTANIRTYLADTKATLRGNPFLLPAGEVSVTLDADYVWNRIESEDSRAVGATQLTRGTLGGGINVGVPITSVRDDVLSALGSITLNGQFRINNLSDFGTLTRWSGGVTWAVSDNLNLQATYVSSEAAPSLQQLGSPSITTLNSPVFDFTTGETVLVSVVSGGNPFLSEETQSDWNFAADWQLPFIDGARFRVEYNDNTSNNVSSAFPLLTPEIEAAFPNRVTRDAAGTLTAIDVRPVDFFETRSKRLSFGLTLRGSVGKAQPSTRGARPDGSGRPAAARPGVGRPDANGNGRGAGRGPRGGEQFAAFRTRLCADDGPAFLQRLVEAAAKGEPLPDFPEFDPARAERMLARLRDENGVVDQQRLASFRDRICSSAGGPAAGQPGNGGQSSAGSDASGEGQTRPRQAGGRGGPPGLPGRGGDGRGRYFLNFNHSIELEQQVIIAQGGPVLDLLDGDSTSQFGTPRHTSRLEGGLFWNGWGTRVSGRYTGAASVNSLTVNDLATIDFRLFADLGRVLNKDDGILDGMRVSLRFDNIFDGRRRVTDVNGETPINYQPLLIDPTGRYLGIDIRKLF